VWCAHLASADNAGIGGVSEPLEISEHETKSPGAVPDDVLGEDGSRLDGVDEAGHVGPEPPVVIGAEPTTGQ
jgi:hypothetical protein